jgi:CheY-like chemotaxis protein
MNPDQLNGFIIAVGDLLGAVLWPALVVFLAVKFGPGFMKKFAESDRVTLKAAGVEASFQQQQVEAAAALGAANARLEGTGTVAHPGRIASAIEEAVPDARAQRRLQNSSVLWVDDRPDNNRYERQALEALGIRVELAVSTEEALEKIGSDRPFNLIISDMGRPPDFRAGYTLLDKLRGAGNPIPYIIYAGSRLPEHVREARERGALGCTNSPQELILMVASALGVQTHT